MKLTIDTNRINARGKEAAMNVLERWASDGRVVFLATERLVYETASDAERVRKRDAMKYIGEPAVCDASFFDAGAYLSKEHHPDFAEIASVLFPGKDVASLQKNEVNDVMHILSHHDGGGDIFVTKDEKDFIKAGRRELLKQRWGIVVMTDEEVVAYLKEQHGWN